MKKDNKIYSMFGYSTIIAVVCVLLFTCRAKAQVSLSVKFENQAVIEFESILMTVKIINVGETPLVFSDYYRNAELGIRITRPEQSLLRSENVEIVRDIVIMPGEEVSELIELSSIYPITETGSYKIAAQVKYNDKTFTSRLRILDVVRGIDILQKSKNLFNYEDIHLTYELRYWKRNDSEYLFMVVKDKDRHLSYGTFQLGRIVRYFKPEIHFGKKGFVTIIHQSGSKRYTRSVFKPKRNGISFTEQTHHLSNGALYPGS